jgi:Tol biopolymer transport system component
MIKSISKLYLLALFFIFPLALFSQFGKNIVQYQKFNWKYIETKHFDIYYNEGSKYLADFAAYSIEEALRSVQSTLNFKINKKIKLIIYDTHNEFQQTNVISQFMPEGVGGVTELAKNRIVVPFQGSFAQFDHVIHHELVHAVMNDMYYGGTFQTALQSGNLGKIPIWISEGLAEYESLNGYNIETDMFMRDVSLNEKLRDLKNMNGYYAYRGGQAFFWYISEKYGKERVGDFMNRLRIQRDLESAFKSSFNMTLEEFSDEFKNELKEYYWPDIEKFNNPKKFADRITNHEKEENFYNSSPAISPDGKQMAYISAPDGIFSIMIRDIEEKDKDKKPKKIVSSFRAQDFEDLNILTPGISWNKDGTKLAISAKSGGEDAIFIVDIKSQDYEKIKIGFNSITSVNWSNDGEKIAFIAIKNNQSDIYYYNINSKEVVQITNDVFYEAGPVWDSESKFIYFISDRGKNIAGDYSNKNFKIWKENYDQTDIYRINSLTKSIERLTFSPEDNKTSVVVAADSKNILFTSDANGISNVYNLNLSTKKIRPITNSQTGISQLNLSVDDSKLLFSTLIEGAYDIYLMRFPFDNKLESDNLPLTKYKNNILTKNKILNDIKNKKLSSSSSDSLNFEKKVYGNFEVEFERQEVISPNKDAENQVSVSEENIVAEIVEGEYPERSYKITFSPDIISGNPGYSTFWGFQGTTQMLFSDVLGDHKIFLQANLLLDLKNSNFYAAYLYQPEIIDYMISGYHNVGYVSYGYDTLNNPLMYRFRDFGAELGASYPLDLFNRIEWGINIKSVSKENIYNHNEPSISRMLFIPQGRYVHDDVLYGMFSPIRGLRYYVGFMGTPKFSNSGIGFITFNSDVRGYIQISDYTSIAIRGAVGASMGPNPQNFYLGGTDYWINSWFSYDRMPFNEPEDFAFIRSSFIMPLRGYGVGVIKGSQYFLANVEFRFPFIGWLLATPIPIAQAFMGAVFFDIGGAWSGNLTSFKATAIDEEGDRVPNHLLMSTGVGIRTGLLGIPVKLDVAWANHYYKWSEPKWIFSLGYDF